MTRRSPVREDEAMDTVTLPKFELDRARLRTLRRRLSHPAVATTLVVVGALLFHDEILAIVMKGLSYMIEASQ